jgi:hypothetical protein
MNGPGKARRRFKFVVMLSTLCMAAVIFHFRLALTPDRVIAARIRVTAENAHSPEEVVELLRRSYRILGGLGRGAWVHRADIPAEELGRLSTVQILVGEYRLSTLSVDAIVLINDSGGIRDVVVRRTFDGP